MAYTSILAAILSSARRRSASAPLPASVTHAVRPSDMTFNSNGELTGAVDEVSDNTSYISVTGTLTGDNTNGYGMSEANSGAYVQLDTVGDFQASGDHLAVRFRRNTTADDRAIMIGGPTTASFMVCGEDGSGSTTADGYTVESYRSNGVDYITGGGLDRNVIWDDLMSDRIDRVVLIKNVSTTGVFRLGWYALSSFIFEGEILGWARFTDWADADAVEEYLLDDPIVSTPDDASGLWAWWDPSDLTTLWKDTAGTDPVTSDGDLVARIDDKSGGGLHLTQGTTSARGIYRTDGTYHWIEFDPASNQHMVINPVSYPTTIEDFFICWGQREVSRRNSTPFSFQNNPVDNRLQGHFPYGDGNFYFDFSGASGDDRNSGTWPLSVGEDAVVALKASVTDSERYVRINGNTYSSGSTVNAASPSQSVFFLGRDNNGNRFDWRFYGMAIYTDLAVTDSVRESLENYFKNKAGVTLALSSLDFINSVERDLAGTNYLFWHSDDETTVYQDTSATTPTNSVGQDVQAIDPRGNLSGTFTYDGATPPVISELNSRFAIDNGSSGLSNTGGATNRGTQQTFFAVVDADDFTAGSEVIFQIQNTGGLTGFTLNSNNATDVLAYSGSVVSATRQASGVSLFVVRRNGTTTEIWENGVLLTSGNAGLRNTSDNRWIHQNYLNNEVFTGKSFCHIYVNEYLSDSVKTSIENALMSFYGISS